VHHTTVAFFPLVVLTLSSGGCSQRTETDVVAAFKRVVEDGVKRAEEDKGEVSFRAAEPTYSIRAAWGKLRCQVDTPSYDVKKTDSLVSPYVAKITINAKYERTKDFGSQSEAEAPNAFPMVSVPKKYEFDYAFQDGKWILKSSNVYDSSLNKWFDIKAGQQGGMMASYFTP